jgi:hypothetical protein
MTSDAPLSQRREAAQLLVALPPGRRRGRRCARGGRSGSRDRRLGGGRRARLGDAAARPRVQAIVARPRRSRPARARGAGAGRRWRDGGVPVLGDALDHCDDVLLCRAIITTLGKLRDPAGRARADQAPARGAEPARDGGRAGRHRRSAAAEALLERLRGDEYVPVRIAAAKALAKLGDARVAALVDDAARQEKEAAVIAAPAPPPPPSAQDELNGQTSGLDLGSEQKQTAPAPEPEPEARGPRSK